MKSNRKNFPEIIPKKGICALCSQSEKDCKCETYNCKCIVYSIECIWPYCTCEKCLELNPMCECRKEND